MPPCQPALYFPRSRISKYSDEQLGETGTMDHLNTITRPDGTIANK